MWGGGHYHHLAMQTRFIVLHQHLLHLRSAASTVIIAFQTVTHPLHYCLLARPWPIPPPNCTTVQGYSLSVLKVPIRDEYLCKSQPIVYEYFRVHPIIHEYSLNSTFSLLPEICNYKMNFICNVIYVFARNLDQTQGVTLNHGKTVARDGPLDESRLQLRRHFLG